MLKMLNGLKIPCVYMRGGTSKAVFFNAKDIPEDQRQRDSLILRAFGSPDLRQIDGMGGANSSTSKVAIIGLSKREDCDIDYTFGQVSVDLPIVGWSMNCGNISSAVGPYAVNQGMVKATEPITTVKIFNTNTKKKIIAHVPVKGGKAVVKGDYAINGVPGTGAKIDLEFEDPGGAVSGKLIPTGKATETVDVNGEKYTISFVDAANPVVFCKAEEFGLKGTELPSEFMALPNFKKLSDTFEKIRAKAAVWAGLVEKESDAAMNSPELPKIGFFARPQEYTDAPGSNWDAKDMDIVGRLFSMGKMINAYMGTGAICTIVAANIPGTVVNDIVKDKFPEDVKKLRIAHPFGIMPVEATIEDRPEGHVVRSGIFSRTARTIMEGYVYIDDNVKF
jgi:2-methylaconitate cis-trans-isomerase PrpF